MFVMKLIRSDKSLSLLGNSIACCGYNSGSGCDHAHIKGLGSGSNVIGNFFHYGTCQLFVGQTDTLEDLNILEGGVDYSVMQTEHHTSLGISGDFDGLFLQEYPFVNDQGIRLYSLCCGVDFLLDGDKQIVVFISVLDFITVVGHFAAAMREGAAAFVQTAFSGNGVVVAAEVVYAGTSFIGSNAVNEDQTNRAVLNLHR